MLPKHAATPIVGKFDDGLYEHVEFCYMHCLISSHSVFTVFGCGDILPSMSILAQSDTNPTEYLLKQTKRIMLYLEGTRRFLLIHGKDQSDKLMPQLEAVADSDCTGQRRAICRGRVTVQVLPKHFPVLYMETKIECRSAPLQQNRICSASRRIQGGCFAGKCVSVVEIADKKSILVRNDDQA